MYHQLKTTQLVGGVTLTLADAYLTVSKASKSKQKWRGQLGMMMPFFGLLEVAAATMPMVNTKRKGKGLILASTICLDTDLPYSPTDKEGTSHFLSFFWSSRFGRIPNFYRKFVLKAPLKGHSIIHFQITIGYEQKGQQISLKFCSG